MTSEIPLNLDKIDSKKVIDATADFISMCFANDLEIWSNNEEAPDIATFNNYAVLYRYTVGPGKEDNNVIVFNTRNERTAEIYSKILKINVPREDSVIPKIPAMKDVRNGMRVFFSNSRMIYAVMAFDNKDGMIGTHLPEISRKDMVLEMQRVIKRNNPSLN